MHAVSQRGATAPSGDATNPQLRCEMHSAYRRQRGDWEGVPRGRVRAGARAGAPGGKKSGFSGDPPGVQKWENRHEKSVPTGGVIKYPPKCARARAPRGRPPRPPPGGVPPGPPSGGPWVGSARGSPLVHSPIARLVGEWHGATSARCARRCAPMITMLRIGRWNDHCRPRKCSVHLHSAALRGCTSNMPERSWCIDARYRAQSLVSAETLMVRCARRITR